MFAKIRLYNEDKGTIYSTSVATWGSSEAEARQNIEKMVCKWAEVTSFTVVKISNQPIFIDKYYSEIQLIYSNRKARTIRLNVTAESITEADEIVREILSGFENVYSYHILNTGLRK